MTSLSSNETDKDPFSSSNISAKPLKRKAPKTKLHHIKQYKGKIWFAKIRVKTSFIGLYLLILIVITFLFTFASLMLLPSLNQLYQGIELSLDGLYEYSIQKSCFKLQCGYVCPDVKSFKHKGWAKIDHLPYATLKTTANIFSFSNFTDNLVGCANMINPSSWEDEDHFFAGYNFFKSSSESHKLDHKCPSSTEEYTDASYLVQSCLSLDVIYPLDTKTSLPVLMYIGSRDLFYQESFLPSIESIMKLNVIFVNIRVRLGVFGFAKLGSTDSEYNNAVNDLQNAIQFFKSSLVSKVNGDIDRITLFAEGSAVALAGVLYAQTRKMSTDKTFFNKLWLQNGLPNFPDDSKLTKNDFVNFLLSDPIMQHKYDEWYSNNSHLYNNRIITDYSLISYWAKHNLEAKDWLRPNYQPMSWRKIKYKSCTLPSLNERETSMMKATNDESFPCLLCELSRPMKKFYKDIPIVILQNLEPSSFTRDCNFEDTDYKSLVKISLNTFSKVTSRDDLTEQILDVYRAIETYYKNSSLIKVIIRDLRANCPLFIMAKLLRLRRQIINSPLFLIYDYSIERKVEYVGSMACDMPWFILGQGDACVVKGNEQYPKLKEELFTSLHKFVHGEKVDLKNFAYPDPNEETDATIEDMINFIGQSPTEYRKMVFLKACNLWSSEFDIESDMKRLLKHSNYY